MSGKRSSAPATDGARRNESWKAGLPCTRAEAEAAADDLGPLGLLDPPPTVIATEPDPDRPDAWRLEAYFESRPDDEALALLAALAPSAGTAPVMERLPDEDWLTLSQAGLEPIRAGRFFVHTAAHADRVPPDAVPFVIEAGRAFGTGQHATTAGCLAMLDRMRRQGTRVEALVDLGTGTGLLAFAAMHLWPRARATASDIDPVSIEVAAGNAAANNVAIGGGRGTLALVVADGLDDPLLLVGAPYDLVIANILAAPLIDLAPAIGAVTARGGSVVLAGLLAGQADAVAAAYRRAGFRLADRIDRGEWPTLRMRRR